MFLALKGLFVSLNSSSYIIESRFKSFSPVREANMARFFVNADGYYDNLCSDLSSVKYEVFIRGWWVCPELYLRRPIENHPESRLDLVLEKAAKRGWRSTLFSSKSTKAQWPTILSMQKNISKSSIQTSESSDTRVIAIKIVPLFNFWSHHEKSVVIDQKIGYLGGIDLCYGRYDNENYALSEPLKNATYFPGSDFNNVRIKDFAPARFADKCMIDKRSVPRMPWRDVQVRLKAKRSKTWAETLCNTGVSSRMILLHRKSRDKSAYRTR